MRKISLLLFLILVSCSITTVKDNHKPYVVIMFDDGSKTVYQTAFPILKRYNFPATNALVTKYVGGEYTLSWAEVDTLTNLYGWETAAHTYSHPNFTQITNDELKEDIEICLGDLNSHGYYPQTLAIPYGLVKKEQLPILQEYFKNIRSVKDIHYHNPIDRYYLGCYLVNHNNSPLQVKERIFYAQEHQEDLVVLLFHVIDNSGRKYTYPTEKFEKIIKFLYDNGFEVVTLNDALDKIR